MIQRNATITLSLEEWEDLMQAVKTSMQLGATHGSNGNRLDLLVTALQYKIDEDNL